MGAVKLTQQRIILTFESLVRKVFDRNPCRANPTSSENRSAPPLKHYKRHFGHIFQNHIKPSSKKCDSR